jgi:Ni,Fe-hydrogenase III small subunit/ferredoxin
MPWVTRGLRNGVLTSPYPRRPDGYGADWRGAVSVRPQVGAAAGRSAKELCPTGAIGQDAGGGVVLDRGKCILCGRCVAARPDLFAFDPSPEVASPTRAGLVVPEVEENDATLSEARADLGRRARALRRSVHVRHVDAGSDGSEEWEIAALLNPVYDVHRLGIFFTASPRHADLLLISGAGSAGMAGPVRTTYEAMPDPRVVVAVGTDAASGGMVSPTYATRGGVGDLVPVDVWVPGSPPSPFSILHGILLAVGLIPERKGRR